MRLTKKQNIIIGGLAIAILAGIGIWELCRALNRQMQTAYENNRSAIVGDRNGDIIFLRPNGFDYYNSYIDTAPENFAKLLVKKEDRFFYWHKGVNPFSIVKNLASEAGLGNRQGSSTISQQLAKMLLGQENRRTIKNKMIELAYTAGLEFSNSKQKILAEYSNSIFFGNRIQGLGAASMAYFGNGPDTLTKEQSLQLLATINEPNTANPLLPANIEKAKSLAKNLNIETGDNFTSPAQAKKNLAQFFENNSSLFEISNYISKDGCQGSQQITIDAELNSKAREIIAKDLEELDIRKAKNAAAIIIALPENEILSLIGSPDPDSFKEGYRINMLKEPRQIGSTVKPFIYMKAFEKGMRPYTIIDDREYKYPAGENFSIYPRNYDWQYHGIMTAHYALANSINTAAAKTLEFAGVKEMEEFLGSELAIPSGQDYSNYQMGIALGAVETTILDLSRAYTIFPNEGRLRGLKLFDNNLCNFKNFISQDKTAAQKSYAQLINKILADRIIAQDLFSSASDLNLEAKNYALKTGTSHDYTDSWIVGYTPDFLVAVWVGNADASAMEGVSGQLGAGKIWADLMQLMLNSKYNLKTGFDFSDVVEYQDGNNIQYGLKDDDYERSKNLIIAGDKDLILKPHDGDTFKLEENAKIILQAKKPVEWLINGQRYGTGKEAYFNPQAKGNYKISVKKEDMGEEIFINIF